MPTRREKLAAGRTSYDTVRLNSTVGDSTVVCITSCETCEFGARTSGLRDFARSYATPPVVVAALRTVRKHVAETKHEAHIRVIESRTYLPSHRAVA